MKLSKYDYRNTNNEILKLRDRVLALSNSKLPLMSFFNDIEMSVDDTSYDYIKAFEDLEQICSTIEEMIETIKHMNTRIYNLKMQANSFYEKNKNEWLKQNFYHFEKIPKGYYNIITQPRRTQYKLFDRKGVNRQGSQMFEWLLYNQGFITRGQMECLIKDIKAGKLE